LVFAALNWVLFVRSERRAARARDEQVAFAEQLQRARSYDDAGAMLARHLEHLSPGAVAVVTGPEDRSLAGRPISSGGERVGMAILRSQHDLDAPTERLVHDSILRAAPVLRTLRTLEIAQARAATDPLTGLGNRRLVEDAIARMVAQARRTGDGYAVAVVDLDHFKAVNDTFGHHAGDALLIAIADVLTTATREYDVVGRQGGDEFIVLLSGVREDQALAVMERCRDAIASLRIGDPPIGTTASFGVAAASPGTHHDVESLVRAADAAVYVAKARGGNCIVPGSDDVVDQASAFLA
jgi:diguanylate cyclase (GGDEF)-like protein